MKKLLVTGGAGFIGSNFVHNFEKICPNHEYKIFVLDALTYAGVKQTLDPKIPLEKIDLRDRKLTQQYVLDHKFDGIMHFAAESHVDRSIEDPTIFAQTNILGTLHLLETTKILQKDNKNFRYLQISTDEVYGQLDDDQMPFTEETNINPKSPYSASKASADHMVQAFHHTYGINTVITRCSNNYGPYQYPEKLIPVVISKALNNSPIPVYGNGRNIRDWIHVDDHNRGAWKAFTHGRSGEVYNLGGQSEKRNIDVVKQILDILNRPHSLLEFVTDRLGHDYRYAINFQKAQRELDWTPVVSFEDGLKQTIEWYLENKEWTTIL